MADPRARKRRSGTLAIALGVVISISACGGSDEAQTSAEPATSAPSPSQTDVAEPSPPPTPPEKRADKETQKLAAAGILRSKDFGAGWKEYAEGKTPPQEEWEQTCESTEGALPSSFRTGAVQAGPTMELKKGTAFSTSYSYSLPSVQAAKKMTDVVSSQEWAGCKRQELLDFLEGQDLKKTKVSIDSTKSPSLGQSGFESETTFLYKEKGEVTGYVRVSLYRLENVVILVQEELGYNEDAQLETFADGIHQALTRAYARLNAAL